MTSDIRLGVVGTGFIATEFMKNLARHDGFGVSRVLTRRALKTVTGLQDHLLTNSIDELIRASDLVVECSGDPIWATEVVMAAVSGNCPVVTMNTEFHITTGSAFVGKGLITEAEGDQPGCLAALHEDALAMGFNPIVYGNMKGFLNLDPAPEDMKYWGAKQGISLPMVTSFTDGTKVQAEQILVANHYGTSVTRDGMLGPAVKDQAEASQVLAEEAAKAGKPISDFVVCGELPHGVFIVATHDEAQAESLAYYKLGPGPNYTLIKNNIFVHLEILKTVRRILSGGGVLLDNSPTPEFSLAAMAKKELKPGDKIELGIGSFAVRGHTVHISERPDHIPIGLIQKGVVIEPVARGEILTRSSLQLPDSPARSLWDDHILPASSRQRRTGHGPV